MLKYLQKCVHSYSPIKNYHILAKHLPSAGFLSPSGGAALSASPLRRLRRPFGKPPPSAAVKKKLGCQGRRQLTPPLAVIKKIGASGAPLISGACGAPNGFKKLNPFHEDSEYVLGFEIGQRESDFCSERTESQNHTAIQ